MDHFPLFVLLFQSGEFFWTRPKALSPKIRAAPASDANGALPIISEAGPLSGQKAKIGFHLHIPLTAYLSFCLMVCGTSFDNKKTSKNIFVQFKFKEKLHSIPINCVCRIPFSTSLFFGITTEESRGGRGIGLLHYFFSSGGGRVRLRRS